MPRNFSIWSLCGSVSSLYCFVFVCVFAYIWLCLLFDPENYLGGFPKMWDEAALLPKMILSLVLSDTKGHYQFCTTLQLTAWCLADYLSDASSDHKSTQGLTCAPNRRGSCPLFLPYCTSRHLSLHPLGFRQGKAVSLCSACTLRMKAPQCNLGLAPTGHPNLEDLCLMKPPRQFLVSPSVYFGSPNANMSLMIYLSLSYYPISFSGLPDKALSISLYCSIIFLFIYFILCIHV